MSQEEEKNETENKITYHCECGDTFVSNKGGIGTHLDSTKHKKHLAKLKQTQLITTFFQPKTTSNIISDNSVPSNQHQNRNNESSNHQNHIHDNENESKEQDHMHI